MLLCYMYRSKNIIDCTIRNEKRMNYYSHHLGVANLNPNNCGIYPSTRLDTPRKFELTIRVLWEWFDVWNKWVLGSDFVYLNCWERILSVYLKLLGDVHVFFFFRKKRFGRRVVHSLYYIFNVQIVWLRVCIWWPFLLILTLVSSGRVLPITTLQAKYLVFRRLI